MNCKNIRIKSLIDNKTDGMSKFKLADTIEVSIDVADGIIKKFFNAVPGVEKFLRKCENYTIRHLQSYTPVYRRKRFFLTDGTDKRNAEIGRAGKNAPIQGANADMTKLALIYILKAIKDGKYDAHIVHCVHDEIQCEVHESIADEFKLVMQDCMMRAAAHILRTVPMVVDCKIAKCWSK